jgi:hypothetical protein
LKNVVNSIKKISALFTPHGGVNYARKSFMKFTTGVNVYKHFSSSLMLREKSWSVYPWQAISA